EAEIRDGLDARRKSELGAQHGRLDDADPSYADAFGARGEPEVLDGAARARADCLRLRGRAEDRLAPRSQVDGDAQVQRRVENAFEPVREVRVSTLGRKTDRLGLPAAQEALADAFADLAIADDDEPPRLREAHARREVRGGQDALEHVVGHRP